jgi:integrase
LNIQNAGGGETVAAILVADLRGKKASGSDWQAAKRIIAQVGSKRPREIRASDAIAINDALERSGLAYGTKWNRSTTIWRMLRDLWANYGAPKVDDEIRRYTGLRPRNVTATDEEREAILMAAPRHMRLFVLLCSDLAIRSGTAGRLGKDDYNRESGVLRFTTKKDEKVTMPVTEEIRELLEQCDMASPDPFVRQLEKLDKSRISR